MGLPELWARGPGGSLLTSRCPFCGRFMRVGVDGVLRCGIRHSEEPIQPSTLDMQLERTNERIQVLREMQEEEMKRAN